MIDNRSTGRRGQLVPIAHPSHGHSADINPAMQELAREYQAMHDRFAPSRKWLALILFSLAAAVLFVAGETGIGPLRFEYSVSSMWFVAALVAAGLLLLGRLFWPLMTRQIIAHERTEAALVEANARLQAGLAHLEKKTHEVTLLNQMSQLLQTCVSTHEAKAVIGQFAERLFPLDSGAICVHNDSLDLVETISSWGDWPPAEPVFGRQDCWALRYGQLHAVTGPRADLLCPHWSNETPPGDALCVPMLAQGESLGVLLLRRRRTPSPDPVTGPARPSVERKELATTVAGHIAMALANLRLREKLRAQSIRDSLTGLYNRRYLNEALDREIRRAARGQRHLAVIVLDVDGFKGINDTWGHEAGDAFLRELGSFLQKRVREEDVACRYGGDEFVVLLAETSLEAAKKRARQLRDGIRNLSVPHRGMPLKAPTVSLGAALYPDHGTTAEELMRAADDALYQAKARGRDCLIVSEKTEGD
jgi:diguanylate cyclase (GGDEF)-like protein